MSRLALLPATRPTRSRIVASTAPGETQLHLAFSREGVEALADRYCDVRLIDKIDNERRVHSPAAARVEAVTRFFRLE